MNTRRYQGLVVLFGRGRHIIQVEDEVTYLPKELILVDIPLRARPARDIRIRIEESDPLEGVAPLDSGRVVRVADELRVIELNHGRAELVCAWGEVDDGALGECVPTLLTTARVVAARRLVVPGTHSGIDGLCRVGVAGLIGTKLSHITEELVAVAS